MHMTHKTRLLILSLALLASATIMSPPEPAEACTIYFIEDCYYPNGVWCRSHPCGDSWCTGTPDGTPSCDYEQTCCP